jgi:hypothetical protein
VDDCEGEVDEVLIVLVLVVVVKLEVTAEVKHVLELSEKEEEETTSFVFMIEEGHDTVECTSTSTGNNTLKSKIASFNPNNLPRLELLVELRLIASACLLK